MATTATTPDVTTPEGLSATSLFYYLLVPAVVLWYVYWRVSRKHLIELAEKLPGPKGYPIIGNALELLGKSPGTYLNLKIFCKRIFSKITPYYCRYF